MKIFLRIIICIFILSSSTAKGQFNKSEKTFLMWFFNDYRESEYPIFYLENKDNRHLLEALKPDTLLDNWAIAGRHRPPNKLILTRKEKELVLNRLDELKCINWVDHLIPSARLLSKDTVVYYSRDRLFGWQRMYKRGISGFYSFSKPIFLRNESICIFQYNYSCGYRCGEGAIMVFKAESGKWKRFINLTSWET